MESNSLIPLREVELLDATAEAMLLITQQYISRQKRLKDDDVVDQASSAKGLSIRESAIPGQSRPILEVVEQSFNIFSHRLRMDNPRSLCFIPSPVSPVSWLGDVLVSSFNTLPASWFQASGPCAIEDSLIRWLALQTGMPSSAGGLFVSGGSMANLTALMLARDRILQYDERVKGVAYVSDQTHSSVAKGLRVLGFLDSQIHKVQSDGQFRMNVKVLEEAIIADRNAGLVPFAVVASCGTTNTGSIDPLHAIADIAHEQGLWMHVDGAYGASVSLSKSHRSLLEGLGQADSISWDAHKWLFQTYACGMVLVRDKRHLVQSFANNAEYLRDAIESEDTPNFWNYGLELTRPARAMKLWFSLQVLGLDAVGEMIDHGFVLAEKAEAELRKLHAWEIVSPASMAILNFRYCPIGKSEEELDGLNVAISQWAICHNVAAILTTNLIGRRVLRICAISPQMSEQMMCDVIKSLDMAARELSAGY